MVEEREVVTLLLGVGALSLAVKNWRTLTYLTAPGLLLVASSLLVLGWVSTNLEGVAGETFDTIEHVCYGLSSLVLALWAYRTAKR